MKNPNTLYVLASALFLSTAAMADPKTPEALPQERVPTEIAAAEPHVAPPDAPPAAAPDAASETVKPTSRVSRFADRCTNFTSNGWAFKSPRNFLKWLDVFSDPGVYLEFGRRGLDPDQWLASLDSLMDPGTPRNHLEWTNPALYGEWAKAAADPAFVTAVNSLLFDPGRMMRWVMLPLDGQAWGLAATALSPETWVKWLNAPQNPKTQALFAKAANPETARRWLEALVDPNNTPWFNPVASAQAPAPARSVGSNPYLSPASHRL